MTAICGHAPFSFLVPFFIAKDSTISYNGGILQLGNKGVNRYGKVPCLWIPQLRLFLLESILFERKWEYMFLERKQSDGNANNLTLYYPNRRNLFALPLFAVGCAWGIWVCAEPVWNSGKIVTEYLEQMIFGLTVSICCILCAKVLFSSAQQVLYCAEDGLYLAYDRRADTTFIPWNDEIYVYETKNFKGQIYWVFSKKPLNKNESQHLATKSSWLSRIHIEDTFVV